MSRDTRFRASSPEVSARPISSYLELSVPPPLRRFLSCVWVHRVAGDDDTYVHPVHPDFADRTVALDDVWGSAGAELSDRALAAATGEAACGWWPNR